MVILICNEELKICQTIWSSNKAKNNAEPENESGPASRWSEWCDLNTRPLGPEPSALPAAPHPEMAKMMSSTAKLYHIFILLSRGFVFCRRIIFLCEIRLSESAALFTRRYILRAYPGKRMRASALRKSGFDTMRMFLPSAFYPLAVCAGIREQTVKWYWKKPLLKAVFMLLPCQLFMRTSSRARLGT